MNSARIALALVAIPMASLCQSTELHSKQISGRVATARCEYTPNDKACRHPGPGQSSGPVASGDARCPFTPCPQIASCCPDYYPPPYRPPYVFEAGYSNHAGAGALIGFGVGAAAGAARCGDPRARFACALVVGGIGALVGGVIGHGIPSNTFHRHHRRNEDLEDDVAANSSPATRSRAPANAGNSPPLSETEGAAVPEEVSAP